MKLALILLILFLALNITIGAYADELQIYFDCYPTEIQAEFNKVGKKLDLSANDRTKESWGFLVSKGTHYSIFTYNSVTPQDLELIQEILWQNQQ